MSHWLLIVKAKHLSQKAPVNQLFQDKNDGTSSSSLYSLFLSQSFLSSANSHTDRYTLNCCSVLLPPLPLLLFCLPSFNLPSTSVIIVLSLFLYLILITMLLWYPVPMSLLFTLKSDLLPVTLHPSARFLLPTSLSLPSSLLVTLFSRCSRPFSPVPGIRRRLFRSIHWKSHTVETCTGQSWRAYEHGALVGAYFTISIGTNMMLITCWFKLHVNVNVYVIVKVFQSIQIWLLIAYCFNLRVNMNMKASPQLSF